MDPRFAAVCDGQVDALDGAEITRDQRQQPILGHRRQALGDRATHIKERAVAGPHRLEPFEHGAALHYVSIAER